MPVRSKPSRKRPKKPARAKASIRAGRGGGQRKPVQRRKRAAAKPTGASTRRTNARKPRSRNRAGGRKRRAPIRLARLRRIFSGSLAGRRRLLLVPVALAVLAAAYFGWFRDSPLVGVRDVEVVGVSGSQQQRIEKALGKAAEEMTTLHVREEALVAAAAAFPDIESVSADASFPSGLKITVEQSPPVLLAQSKAQTVAVARDGALLPGVEVPNDSKLPAVDVSALPESGRLEGTDLEQALIVGAAPEPLRPLIEKVGYEEDEGVVVVLEGGLPVHFGTGAGADAKWEAAAAVLADPKLKRLTYVDVRVPERAAAGGAASTQPAEEELAPADPATTADPATAPTDIAGAAPADVDAVPPAP